MSQPTDIFPPTPARTTDDATTTTFRDAGRYLELVKRADVVSVDGYTHLGCWQDGSNHILSVTAEFDNGMTPELCRNMCSLVECPMFGVENGYHCYCGTSIEPFAVSATGDACTATCWGDEEKICGGPQRMNVYSTNDPSAGGKPPASATNTNDGTKATTTTSGSKTTSESDAKPDSGSDPDSNPGSSNGGDSDGSSGDAASSSSSSSSSSGSPLSIGAIVGIAIGAAVLAGIVAALLVLLFRRRRRDNGHSVAPQPAPPVTQVHYNTPHPPSSEPVYPVPGYAKTDPNLNTPPTQSIVTPINTPPPPTGTISPTSTAVPQANSYYEMQSSPHVAHEMASGR
ncbi:hypothetical protein ACHAQA_008556 [Verticillium albo-atrum]